MNTKHTQSEPLLSGDLLARVELVGGPLCGDVVQWPAGNRSIELRYHGGTCTYKYEGKGKAIYAFG